MYGKFTTRSASKKEGRKQGSAKQIGKEETLR